MNIFYNQFENFNHVESFIKNHDFFGQWLEVDSICFVFVISHIATKYIKLFAYFSSCVRFGANDEKQHGFCERETI